MNEIFTFKELSYHFRNDSILIRNSLRTVRYGTEINWGQFWNLPNIFWFLKWILSLKSFGNEWGSLYIKFIILDIKSCCVTWGESNLHWNGKWSKYHVQDCLKFFYWHVMPLIMIQISEYSPIMTQNRKIYEKNSAIKGLKLSNVNFWPESNIQFEFSKNFKILKFERNRDKL